MWKRPGKRVQTPRFSPTTSRPFASSRTEPTDTESTMILGPVSYLDCAVFCLFLAPQLLWHVGLFGTVECVLRALPFLLFELPVCFVRERWFREPEKRPLFVQKATPFEDFVIRCVRYAFANIPPHVGRVFFSRAVAQPFFKFRMLRHGYLTCPIHWREHRGGSFKGVWAVRYAQTRPDIVLYYIHGGGFSMGSSYFYLEFLLTWLSVLVSAGYENPAIFALDYTLVPDGSYPTQLKEAKAAYEHVVEVAGNPSIVCVSGDSAGALLVLSLLLHLADERPNVVGTGRRLAKPGLATLISPWVTLVSGRENTTASDYLDIDQLNKYGRMFAGQSISETDPLVSPGCCKDMSWWKRASPLHGIFVTYGSDEVLASDIEGLIRLLREAGVVVGEQGEPGGIHAWPVASLFLCSGEDERLKGLKTMTEEIRNRMRLQVNGV